LLRSNSATASHAQNNRCSPNSCNQNTNRRVIAPIVQQTQHASPPSGRGIRHNNSQSQVCRAVVRSARTPEKRHSTNQLLKRDRYYYQVNPQTRWYTIYERVPYFRWEPRLSGVYNSPYPHYIHLPQQQGQQGEEKEHHLLPLPPLKPDEAQLPHLTSLLEKENHQQQLQAQQLQQQEKYTQQAFQQQQHLQQQLNLSHQQQQLQHKHQHQQQQQSIIQHQQVPQQQQHQLPQSQFIYPQASALATSATYDPYDYHQSAAQSPGPLTPPPSPPQYSQLPQYSQTVQLPPYSQSPAQLPQPQLVQSSLSPSLPASQLPPQYSHSSSAPDQPPNLQFYNCNCHGTYLPYEQLPPN
ncbi:putative mediator of RNA polymerase II transcription subunit 12, partial [Bactrocera neohumeralis]|uniref:putative mediator of RNA polymerase II transcription subunit 12 n=1 Tax=Bactrocera neohumeralis TaxID=98809 RepID=UPI0021661589